MDIAMRTEMLDDTGERMVPELSDDMTFWEHVHRYRFAAKFVSGKRVLDIACGEGYGTHALALAGARSVIGVDISEQACEHARQKYGIDARHGSAEAIPLPACSVDVVVSFETIEHIHSPAAFLDECIRVLDSRGVLVISTPNTDVYNSSLAKPNPFHCSEMSEEKFAGMLRPRFRHVCLFSQCLKTAGWWSPRSFVAKQSPWTNVRGYWRLRRYLCPYIMDDVDERFRRSPAETILVTEGGLSKLVNPYSVRRRSYTSGESPTYLIATGRPKP